MASQIQCECGYVARGETDDAVVGQIREHLQLDHPDVARTVNDDAIRSWIEVVD